MGGRRGAAGQQGREQSQGSRRGLGRVPGELSRTPEVRGGQGQSPQVPTEVQCDYGHKVSSHTWLLTRAPDSLESPHRPGQVGGRARR